MLNYLLRDVGDDLWRRAKIYAAKNDKTLKELLIEGLTERIKEVKNAKNK